MIANLFADLLTTPEQFVDTHSRELTVIVLSAMVLMTLLLLIPRLLRGRQHVLELEHAERMKSLEQGIAPATADTRSAAAGRTAYLVPIIVNLAAGTVTCFLAATPNDNLFSVALTVWSVAGVVSLAAITGGVALMGRLAQLQEGDDDDVPENPLAK
jgi:hypothetical protein